MSDIEKIQHEQFIKGMETIKRLMIKFEGLKPIMVDAIIEDYKKKFNVKT